MTNLNQIHQFVHSVKEAEKAVIESQGNGDPQRFQHAQNMLYKAKQLLVEVDNHKLKMEAADEKQMLHAKELLRNLEETQHAVEATE